MVSGVSGNITGRGFALNVHRTIISVVVITVPLLLCSCAGWPGGDPVLQAKKTIECCDPFMGDYQGGWKLNDGTDSGSLVARVIALGKGEYRVIFYDAFDVPSEPLAALNGELEGSKVRMTKVDPNVGTFDIEASATIEADQLNGTFGGPSGAGSFELEKTIRLSPTLGMKPPDGAVVLFNGKNFNEWEPTQKKPGVDQVQWKRVKSRAMEVVKGAGSIVTKKKFNDFKLHLEFRTPCMPEARGQGRGNSGVYLQGRYEVQVLDSYGLEGKDNECGGIYKVGAPLVNMCAPPMQWQTYDITFTAPRFDNAGAIAQNARVTVVHNGVTIHDERVLPGPTGGALDNNVAEPGGIYLQDHGNPVQFRNIWLVEL
ncbi:MAG: DUF1080 domain-containing protein [Sedimentisphaerales bacterium]|nr:DUF1080 domain-containing protein [Sedimentisphaerales bacterium]